MRRWQVKANPSKAWGAGARPTAHESERELPTKRALEAGAGLGMRAQPARRVRPVAGPVDRAELLEAFDDWAPNDLALAQYGRKQADGSGYNVAGVVRCRVIAIPERSGTTAETDKAIALCEAAYPAGAFGGAFVCKQISGSSSWSQHAYGRAYDHSAYAANDACTDWCLRMARENAEGDVLLPVNQVLGSQGGRVGNASGRRGPWTRARRPASIRRTYGTCTYRRARRRVPACRRAQRARPRSPSSRARRTRPTRKPNPWATIAARNSRGPAGR